MTPTTHLDRLPIAASELDELRELDHRISDGIDVWLLWRARDGRALVAVSDAKTGDAFTLTVGPDERALDVFHHPYAYAADMRVDEAPPAWPTPMRF